MKIKFAILMGNIDNNKKLSSTWYSELEQNRGKCLFDSLEEVNAVFSDLCTRYDMYDSIIIAITEINKPV